MHVGGGLGGVHVGGCKCVCVCACACVHDSSGISETAIAYLAAGICPV